MNKLFMIFILVSCSAKKPGPDVPFGRMPFKAPSLTQLAPSGVLQPVKVLQKKRAKKKLHKHHKCNCRCVKGYTEQKGVI